MATIADFRLPVEGFPLGAAITADLARRVELERIVPGEEGIVPFFWIQGDDDVETLERTIRETRAIHSFECLSQVANGRLYRARWNEDVPGLLQGIVTTDATILEAEGSTDGWQFKLRFADRNDTRGFQRYCEHHDVPATLHRVYTPREAHLGEVYGLTGEQRETIQRAYEMGYFDEPRGVTQAELAAEFDVSQRAISRRLWRGLGRLVATTVARNDGV